MYTILTQSNVLVVILLGSLIGALFTMVVLLVLNKLTRSIENNLSAQLTSSQKQLNQQIQDSVQAKFITIAPASESFVELSTEIWRLSKRLKKIEAVLDDDQNKALQNSLSKLERFMSKNDLLVTEYTSQKYNQGMNLDVISIEKDPSVIHSTIKDTIEPSVMYRGQILKRAKVVIVEQ